MPTGAVSLIEATQAGSDMHKLGVVETIIQENPVIEMLPWLPFAGNALVHDEEGTLPDVQFRRVNEGYTSSYGSDNQHFWSVAILGGEIKVDRFLVDVVGNEKDIEAKQWAKLAKSNAMRFGYEFFNGTGSVASKGFKGLKALIDEGFGQKYANSTTGAVVNLDKLDEALDLFVNQGRPDRALVNRAQRRQITKAARTTHSGISLIDVGTDVFGKKVMFYDDIPFTIMGDVRDASGNTVPALGFTEDPGDGTSDCSSLYFIKFGEDDVTGLLGKGGSFVAKSFGELESQPQRMGRLEWYPGVAVFNKYSVVRVSGITAS
jgi:hypothetical protein